MPIQVPLSWQVLQLALVSLWIIAAEGSGIWNRLPGTLRVADAGTKPAGVLPRWQLSHVVDVGKCALEPCGLVGGMAMMALMP
jgi:hypothetical protein